MVDQTLARLRRQLRSVDSDLIHVLARRFQLVQRIGVSKQKLKIGVIGTLVEKSAIENFVASAGKAGVAEDYARRIAELIIEGSVDVQMRSRPPAAQSDALLKRFSEGILRAERKGRKLIRLDIGEPRFRTPRSATRETKRFLSQHSTMSYGSSYGLPELTDALATRLNDQYGTRLRRTNILIVPGASFGIFAAIRTGVSSLERVVLCQPAWPAYESIIAFVGGRTRSVTTRLGDGWDIDLASLEEELKLQPKMIILNYPNNPTGKVLSERMFRETLELAGKYRTPILSDEVYATYCSKPVPSVLEYPDNEMIYVNSFSKEFSMTGWRIAYVVADEHRIARMRRIVETVLTNVPEFVQRAALAALKDSSRDAAASRERIARRLEMACRELRKGDLEFYHPDGGLYLFPRVQRRGIDSTRFAKRLFEKHAVSVLPGTIFGGYKEFLRLAITESETVVRTGVRRIVKAIDEW